MRETMAISFTDIEGKFDTVFGFIQRDLERFLTLDAGGNFGVAGLAACACETLSRYQYGSGEGAKIFSRLLQDGPFQVIAKDLYDILRNGLVHRYNTADIRVNGMVIRLAIAWRVERHLSVKTFEGVPCVVINVTTLCKDLFKAFSEYREELKKSAEARDRFFKIYRETGTFDVTISAQVAAWKAIMADGLK